MIRNDRSDLSKRRRVAPGEVSLHAHCKTALVVGSISRDVASPEAVDDLPGGVVHHAGLALARLGARTQVLTRVHPRHEDRLLAPLQSQRVTITALPSHATTTCVNDYTGPVDRHEVVAVSDVIGPDDLPAQCRFADIVQLGPLHRNDISPAVAAAVGGLTGLDVQGLVRDRTVYGTRLSPNPGLKDFLPHVDILKVSVSELPAVLDGVALEDFSSQHALREVVITRGARGATVCLPGQRFDVAAKTCSGSFLVGAGDVFFAAYLLSRASGRGPKDAAVDATDIVSEKISRDAVRRRTSHQHDEALGLLPSNLSFGYPGIG